MRVNRAFRLNRKIFLEFSTYTFTYKQTFIKRAIFISQKCAIYPHPLYEENILRDIWRNSIFISNKLL